MGLFPTEGTVEQMAFELAIHKVNLDPSLSDDVKLDGRIEIVDVNDGYQTSKIGEGTGDVIVVFVFVSLATAGRRFSISSA